MKNLKIKLTIIMVFTTLILFFITFLSIYIYQKKYIFDKAISSIENELTYFTDYETLPTPPYNFSRFFNVEVIFLEDKDFYLRNEEHLLLDLYKKGNYQLGKIERTHNDYGEYYFVIEEVPNPPFFDENFSESSKEKIPILLYVDITSSINVIKTINLIFFIMHIIMIIVEGVVGVYLGTKFEDSQLKLKHFFQNASHELKTPLMSIQGYAEGLKTDVIKDKMMASEIIIRKSEKMKCLIDEILTISKLDSKQYVLKKEIVNLKNIIEESLENFSVIKKEKKIELTLDMNVHNAYIISDGLQIYKAVNTVIDNAFKFAYSKIMITLYQDNKFLYLQVYNDGNTISPDNIRHIFDRFYSKDHFSSGIGLAMAKEILTLNKGDILCRNLDDGVIFELKFPKKSF